MHCLKQDQTNHTELPCDANRATQPIMIVATSSDAGKSLIVTALCRILKNYNLPVAPFKAQNLSPTLHRTQNGLWISTSQAMQCEAARIIPSKNINPLYWMKDSNGKPVRTALGKPLKEITESVNCSETDTINRLVLNSYKELNEHHWPIIIEGSGAVCELNLAERDVANMPLAEALNAATILVANIERGGIFAAIHGSLDLMTDNQRKTVKGIIINQFHGDPSIFNDGKKIIEELSGIPVLGIIPHQPTLSTEPIIESLATKPFQQNKQTQKKTDPSTTPPLTQQQREAYYSTLAQFIHQHIDIPTILQYITKTKTNI